MCSGHSSDSSPAASTLHIRCPGNRVKLQPDTLGGFYAASATTDIVSGLFSRRCVLVEGVTEALALPELLRTRGLDILREGIAIVSVEGIGNIAKWHRLYSALGIECYCVFDTDSDKQSKDAANLTRKRRDIMTALGLPEDRGDSENLSTKPIAVTSTHATLNPNFEEAAEQLFGERWTALHTEAVAFVGESKPLRARYTAERLSAEDHPAEATETLDALIKAIRGNSTAPATPDGEQHEPPPT